MSKAPRTAADPQEALSCRLSPSGRIVLRREVSAGALPGSVVRRIVEAFERGRGAGLVQLGAGELTTAVDPTLAYFRELGKLVVSKACAACDPAEPGAQVVVPDAEPAELVALVARVPPMPGAELVTTELLARLWADACEALGVEASAHKDHLQGYLEQQSPVWNVVGRVCLRLAENKQDAEFPFAFVATYADSVSKGAKPQHRMLGQALKAYAGAKNRKKLLSLMAPLSRAAEHSSRLRGLVDSGAVYQPLAWTAAEAHVFLREIEIYEQAGLVVRLPDWWRGTPVRPQVSVSVGGKPPSTLGMDALLQFDVNLTLDGTKLTAGEIRELLAKDAGLVLLRGRWVSVDAEKLSQVLSMWREIQARANEGDVSFASAMRMLAGTPLGGSRMAMPDPELREWSQVVAGKWLASKLDGLRCGEVGKAIRKHAGLDAKLRPYQQVGVQWLVSLRALELGGCLADDMGLGKTIQVLGMLCLAKHSKAQRGSCLLVVPASLLDNWRLEQERFAPQLTVLVAHPSQMKSAKLKGLAPAEIATYDLVITTYGTVTRTPWMKTYAWGDVVLDEAQAIKNPGSKQTRAIKSLRATWRLALTGTPVENRTGDLWSIFDFLNPGLLGGAKEFGRACKQMASTEQGYAPLRRLVQPYILRRLKTDKKVISDLPDKTEVTARCFLRKRQAVVYAQAVTELKHALKTLSGVKRRGVVLAFLMRFKQICNHPSQWLGDGGYKPQDSGKFERLREICESIASRQDKVLVFTQFREICAPLAGVLEGVFGRAGLVLHGGTPVKRRQGMVREFQEQEVPFMVLSLKAGGTGLNLTAAAHVIHFDRWWNPAVENQATDRAFRIGQKRNVLVHKFVCTGTIEERIDELLASKQALSDEVLAGGAQTSLTEMNDDEILSMVALDLNAVVEA